MTILIRPNIDPNSLLFFTAICMQIIKNDSHCNEVASVVRVNDRTNFSISGHCHSAFCTNADAKCLDGGLSQNRTATPVVAMNCPSLGSGRGAPCFGSLNTSIGLRTVWGAFTRSGTVFAGCRTPAFCACFPAPFDGTVSAEMGPELDAPEDVARVSSRPSLNSFRKSTYDAEFGDRQITISVE